MKKHAEYLLREVINLAISESMINVDLRNMIDVIKKKRSSSMSNASKSSFGGGGYGGGGYGYNYGDYSNYGNSSPWDYLSSDSSLAKSFQSSGIKPKELYTAAKENKFDLSKIDKVELEKILMSYADSKIESDNLKQQETEKSLELNLVSDDSKNIDDLESTDAGDADAGDV